ncbi:uncharacterized protein BO66DRAFT_391590 [Aspergillus aculeatinus CBS 121060]|uniref:Uncharacterized protein n=1 Tax=Aspergillus aculeatinus CBS 121060 TaxID=1448322 RepID=A0ACD1HB82_9EURO|nr:hypothetical protein BO66DRAFT_391590 [Aspergillus aculeatinus CBS 121060]RAH70771.1 hypothetical protein BO66DRAFT_391590 [Aspergillus aculeatinus CBS 121060]
MLRLPPPTFVALVTAGYIPRRSHCRGLGPDSSGRGQDTPNARAADACLRSVITELESGPEEVKPREVGSQSVES